MNRPSCFFTFSLICLVGICVTFLPDATAISAWTQSQESQAEGQQESEPTEEADIFSIGIAGHVRLGFWTEVRCPDQQLPATGKMVIQAVDGDGIPVNYRWPLQRIKHGDHSVVVGHFRLGQINHRVKIQILDEQELVVQEKLLDFEQDDSLQLHPATQLLWLELGGDLGTNSVTSGFQRLSEGGMYLIQDVDVSDLPVTQRGCESLNRLILNTVTDDGTVANWPEQISDATQGAFAKWLQAGSRISMSIDPRSVAKIQEGGLLSEWMGPISAEVHSMQKSSAIEFFVGSRSQLLNAESSSLPYVSFPTTAGSDLEIDERPVIARYAVGLGQVDLLGLDLNSEPLASWPSRNNLTAKWLQTENASSARLNTAYGFTDLTGQLRSALDQFQRVTLISFTTVAAILIGFLALVAADYFLMRHVVKRMQFTWVTLPIYCLLACGAVAWIFSTAKSQQMLANQAEVIDIDAVGGKVHGRLWANVYSPTATNLDLKIADTNQLELPVEESAIGWNGLPGTGMGGMMSTKLAIGSDRPYTVTRRATGSEIDIDKQSAIEVLKMPFDVASTRSLRGDWQSQLPFKIESRLTKLPGRDRLYGTFTNPFPVEMKNCFLINGGWAYQFRTTLPPNASIDITTQTDHIALSVWLTRRRATSDTTSQNQPWNPVEDDLHRVLEMLMFYEIGNGQDYTSLLHQYEPFLDFSQLRSLDRAVFLGRTDEPMTTLQFNGQAIDRDQFDQSASAIRISLPVGVRER